MPTLKDYLRSQIAHGYRAFCGTLEGVTEEQARAGGSETWRRYRFGVGLDGSIAGIVWHVAVWKHVVADGIDGGSFPDAEAVLPHGWGWSGQLEWLASGHARLLRVLDELPEVQLERTVVLEGEHLSLLAVFNIIVEHDHYHAGQVNLIRQQQGHTLDA